MNRNRDPDVPSDQSTSRGVVTAADVVSTVSNAVALRHRTGLEYDKIMIVAVIACRHLAETEGRADRVREATTPEDRLLAWNGSTMSLARHLGIPRESVRRKLVELRDDGWLLQDGQIGQYQPSERLLRTLAEMMSQARLFA